MIECSLTPEDSGLKIRLRNNKTLDEGSLAYKEILDQHGHFKEDLSRAKDGKTLHKLKCYHNFTDLKHINSPQIHYNIVTDSKRHRELIDHEQKYDFDENHSKFSEIL